MADLPAHPDDDDDTGIGSAASGPSWKTVLGILVVCALVLLLVVLHLAGVLGAGSHK